VELRASGRNDKTGWSVEFGGKATSAVVGVDAVDVEGPGMVVGLTDCGAADADAVGASPVAVSVFDDVSEVVGALDDDMAADDDVAFDADVDVAVDEEEDEPAAFSDGIFADDIGNKELLAAAAIMEAGK
jgi:hypothetical protein